MTGYNLPPGCTDRMVDEAFGCKREPSELAENVRALLNKAGMYDKRVDIIMDTIEDWEDDNREPDPDDERDSRADYEWDRRR